MIETFNDYISLGLLVVIIIGAVVFAFKFDRMFKRNRDDDYYQDLL